MAAYGELEPRFARLSHLAGASAVLHWDRAAMMPPGGAAARAEQLAALSVLRHELLCQAEVGELLDRAEADAGDLDDWQVANLRGMRWRWRHAVAVPAELVAARSKAASACEMAWRSARAADDFAMLRADLEGVVGLTREVAAAKADWLGCAPYDALLDGYEPAARAAGIDACFGELEGFLPDLVAAVLEAQADPPPITGEFPADRQRRLGRQLMADLGFDFEHGRLDVSHHPFTGGVPGDVRLTTRYEAADPFAGLFAILHECGHALYENGLPADWRGQPVGGAMGMAVHESQSLIIEMQLCRSDAYLAYLAPLLVNAFGVDGPAWRPDNLCRRVRRVARTPIRVTADEVTYPLHVILRYRLERAMLAGDLPIADLPEAWRAGLAELLDIVPPDDADGCLQDIHWMGGDFGYFPTYTLGAIAAAQLYETLDQAEPDLPMAIRRGDFRPLLEWLRAAVHGWGSYHASTDELLHRATGRPLDPGAFRRHLERRYLDN
ncbi:MAG: carboxypeptidase M32 [Alphaproteobacteria bacterium]|nr:carboxypeptidase M32 [Alphaproteobacteria bacterium]MDP6812893.1 carboxypeptidase M32 [Alphaproteobacteria bacterium]